MERPTDRELSAFLATSGARSCRVVALPSGRIRWHGDPKAALALVNSLVGSPSATQNLDASLEGQVLPRIWTQGSDLCLVWKPRADALFLCAFTGLEGGAVEGFEIGAKQDDAVRALFPAKSEEERPG